MALKNTIDSYGWLARLLHWTVGIIIICLLAVGLWMGGLEPPFKYEVYGLHKSFGILVLILVAFRLSWRLMNTTPTMPQSMDVFQRTAAHAVHFFLYVAMLVMPLSGWAMSSAGGYPVSLFGLFQLPPLVEKNKELGMLFHDVHEYLGFALIAAVIVHTGAALLHHFYYKDNVLKRMLKG